MSKIYMVPVSGYMLIQSGSEVDASLTAQALLSEHPHVSIHMSEPLNSVQADSLDCNDTLPINHVGLSVEDILSGKY